MSKEKETIPVKRWDWRSDAGGYCESEDGGYVEFWDYERVRRELAEANRKLAGRDLNRFVERVREFYFGFLNGHIPSDQVDKARKVNVAVVVDAARPK